MARQLPIETYALVVRRRVALVWHQCRICRVSFKWEPFYVVYNDRDLKFPSDEDKAKGIMRYYPYPEHQTVCVHCAKQFGISKAAETPTTNDEFNAIVDKMHAGEQPIPIHDNTRKKMAVVSRERIPQ